MIPSDPKTIEKLKALADRNIANGDWGDEVSPPGEEIPISPAELKARGTVSNILSKIGVLPVPKRKK